MQTYIYSCHQSLHTTSKWRNTGPQIPVNQYRKKHNISVYQYKNHLNFKCCKLVEPKEKDSQNHVLKRGIFFKDYQLKSIYFYLTKDGSFFYYVGGTK